MLGKIKVIMLIGFTAALVYFTITGMEFSKALAELLARHAM